MVTILKGATSQSVYLEVLDSASTTGGRKTGIAFNAAGLTAYYARNGAAATAITLVTQTATGAYSSGGWVEVDATNMPGVYRLDVPNAALASGVDSVVITVKGASGMVQVSKEIQLTAVNLQDAVAFGLSRIDAAITSRMATFTLPTNFSSMVINASGRIDLGTWLGVAPAALSANGYVQAMLLRWLTDNAGGTPNALTSGRVDSILGAITAGIIAAGSFAANALGAVWDELRSAHTTASTFGQGVIVATNNDKTGYTASTVSDKTGYSLAVAPPTAAAISTQVWTEPIPGTFAAGSAGAKLNSASAAGDPLSTAVPGAYGAGTAGYIIGNLPGSVWDVAIASHTSAGSTGNKLNGLSGASGSGALTVTVTVQNDVTHPVAGAQFWVTTDVGGTNIVASGTTDAFGHVTVFLNAGTYYGWAAKPGENFTNPATLVVS